ncbi:MAG: hypothetical protein ABI724_07180 [Betaproteobacteria bacterium]
MANPDEPPRPLPNAAADAAPATAPWNPQREALAFFVAALAIVIVGCLAATVPGRWFPGGSQKEWSPREFVLARGAGGLERDTFVVSNAGGSGSVLVTVETDFRSSDFGAIAWTATNVADGADVRLIWRTDYAPAKLNSAPIGVASGHLLPVMLARDPNWVGRIRGLALAINGPMPQPVRIAGVAAKPMGALDIAGDRLDEWFAFEGISGTSINGVAGGADIQELPLPPFLAAVAGLAALAWFGRARHRKRTAALPSVLALLFVTAWLLHDARWTWNLVRQARATGQTYAGLDWRERHLAAEDAPLFQFIENVRAKLPAEPVRIFMNADAHYFRDRGAYHLYPHNVYFEPYRNLVPASSRMQSGDYFVAYQRRGVQFDSGSQHLRWDGGEPIAAELLLTAPGAALFRIR